MSHTRVGLIYCMYSTSLDATDTFVGHGMTQTVNFLFSHLVFILYINVVVLPKHMNSIYTLPDAVYALKWPHRLANNAAYLSLSSTHQFLYPFNGSFVHERHLQPSAREINNESASKTAERASSRCIATSSDGLRRN